MSWGVLRRTPFLFLFLTGCAEPQARPASTVPAAAEDRRPTPPSVSRPAGLEVTVKQVVDGDTLRVSGLSAGNALVRLTGIDAPETGDGRTTRECFGPEARQWLRDRIAPGTRVRLVTDVADRDRFGRALAYVYAPDGAFLNADLVAGGYARTMTIRPNVRHAKQLADLERRARAEGRGLWAACRQTVP
jgi:micrococcal nuclease